MKKTISRAFSLLLVLALLVSVIPSALAASGSLTISGNNVVTVGGEPISLTAEASDGVSLEGATWEWSGGESVITITGANSSSVSISAKDDVQTESNVTITAKATIAATEPDGEYTVYVGVHNVTVKPAAAPESTLVITQGAATTITYGDSLTLTATYTPAGGQPTTDGIAWSVPSNEYFDISTDGLITIKKAGGAAKVTASAGSGETAAQAEITVTVAKKGITAELTDIPTVLQPKGTQDANFTTSELTQQDFTAVWSSNDVSKLTVDSSSGLITAVATGKTQIKLTLTLSEEKFANYQFTGNGVTDNGKSITLTSSDILVGTGSIELNKTTANLQSGSNDYATFTIKKVDLPSNISTSDVEYSFVKTATGNSPDVTISDSSNSFTVSKPTGEGAVKITVQVKHKDTKEVIAQTEVTIGVYKNNHTIYATVKSGVNSFDFDEKVYSYMKVGDTTYTTPSLATLEEALKGNEAYGYITFSSNGAYLKLDTSGTLRNTLGNVTATPTGTSGTQTIIYTWYTDNSKTVKVAEGSLYITIGETSGDVVYNTSYKEKVVFDNAKFQDFWDEMVKDKQVTGTLSYISFPDYQEGVMPKYGSLYRETSCTYAINKTANYYLSTSSSSNYRLDNVTYKPDSSITSPVTVQIPFTAYNSGSGLNRDSVSGVIVININQESTTITSYGVGFGNGTNSIADYIVETFKANTGDTLSYVTFPSLSASTGKLLYDFSGVLDSREVLSTYKFYYNGSKTDLDLDDVVFVPRAGLYGEVTLYYKAYNASATKEYSGTIVLNVQQKTKSAEFSDVGTSYSWAADSVDFLNYEGIAEGSNGKYRPSAYITRGDFMLMLYRAFLEDEHKNDSITSNFSDVTKGSDTYSKETYQAVGVAKKLGIAQGTNGKFNPKSYITRQEAMTLIYRTLDEVNYDLEYTVSTSTSSFKDYSSVASYAKTAISDLIGHGIVIGNNSKINPTSNITRAEMAVILHRVLTY